MSHWPLKKEDVKRPAYRSLAQAIAAAIGSGSLRPGQRLPTHRELAWQLDVSVQTVSRAYEELIRADLVSGEVGRGTFVQYEPREYDEMPWQDTRGLGAPIDLSLMTPVRLPEMAAAWSASLQRIAETMPDTVMHALRPEQVATRYSDLAVAWLARCGLVVNRQRLLITNGVTPAMFTALAVVANPGEVIAADTFSSHTLGPAAQHLHVGLKGVEGDERGMIPEALIEAARESPGQMKAVFLLPGGAGPQARIMDRERREALALAAEEVGLAILECDPLGPLAARRPPPIASLAPDRTFYFTGMSKSLAPGLRLGFLATPEEQVELTVNRHHSVSWMATPLVAEIASDWLESGIADRLLLAHRAELSARNRMAQRVLGPRCFGSLHGLHRWLPLSAGADEGAVIRRLLEEGVAVAPGSGFSVSDTRPAIRICLGATGRRNLERALITIGDLFPPQTHADTVGLTEASSELS